jgi:actin related protein 2/3 complex subunit 2
MTVADFDGVTYHISTSESKSVLDISLGWACCSELLAHGAADVLKREYGEYLLPSPEQGYSVTLRLDSEKLPTDAGKDIRFFFVFVLHVYTMRE